MSLSIELSLLSDLIARVRDLTGLSTDEISDTIINQFLLDSWEKVKNITGRHTWVLGEQGYAGAEEAVIFFAAQRAYLRAGMKDKAKEAENEGTIMATSLLSRVQGTIRTG